MTGAISAKQQTKPNNKNTSEEIKMKILNEIAYPPSHVNSLSYSSQQVF